jgi:hypothetical protein
VRNGCAEKYHMWVVKLSDKCDLQSKINYARLKKQAAATTSKATSNSKSKAPS